MSEPALAAFRLADSALPVGTDSVSYAVEQFAAADRIDDADDLRALLASYLRRQIGPGDLVALRHAHAAAADGDLAGVVAADRRLTATTTPAEFRESSERTGERLLALQTEVGDDDLLDAYASRVGEDDADAPGNYAVALGAVAAREGVPVREACLLACHEFVTGLLQAAQRLIGISHTDLQGVLDDLAPAIEAAIDDSAGRSLAEMAPFAPLVDVLSAEHERADRRLFLS
ncbi:urease accessory protein UreF [Halobellus rubicundus]|uniref:Urease accessory protein UreF n=1 Tax=Halobellus rubicundus TaxID=2996466 RepID=A0ABD5MED8_9EURY